MRFNYKKTKKAVFIALFGWQIGFAGSGALAQTTQHDVGVTAKVSEDAKIVSFYITLPVGKVIQQNELFIKVKENALGKEHFRSISITADQRTLVLEAEAGKVEMKEVEGLVHALRLDITSALTDHEVAKLVKEKKAQN